MSGSSWGTHIWCALHSAHQPLKWPGAEVWCMHGAWCGCDKVQHTVQSLCRGWPALGACMVYAWCTHGVWAMHTRRMVHGVSFEWIRATGRWCKAAPTLSRSGSYGVHGVWCTHSALCMRKVYGGEFISYHYSGLGPVIACSTVHALHRDQTTLLLHAHVRAIWHPTTGAV